ncbi:hypothetical protein MtrunA17_Chr4g0014571 [Medicago truncatula]|uniref:Transmembrane protein n=1 Tax=Medicago truncatula TaxID=3880 RepID=A0A396I7C5_MEDTR|nr:hypothetical protein MtrunA17_Chr4g0014571 [Medicago truncatula]
MRYESLDFWLSACCSLVFLNMMLIFVAVLLIQVPSPPCFSVLFNFWVV